MKTCSICVHPDRAAIDAALVAGDSLRVIEAGHTGTTRSALDRHRKHLAPALTQAKQAEAVADATTLLSRIERLMSRCENLFESASKDRKWAGAAAAARELRGCLELVGRLSGELQTAGTRIAISTGDIQKIDIRMLTDDQLKALAERIDSSRAEEIHAMTNEEIEAELASILGVGKLEYLMPEVTFTAVESMIRTGFPSDGEYVQRALKEKEEKVETYQRAQRELSASNTTIQGVR